MSLALLVYNVRCGRSRLDCPLSRPLKTSFCALQAAATPPGHAISIFIILQKWKWGRRMILAWVGRKYLPVHASKGNDLLVAGCPEQLKATLTGNNGSKICALLGFYSAQNGSFYWRFGTTNRSRLQGSSSPWRSTRTTSASLTIFSWRPRF